MIIPAIDLARGRVVRLQQGDFSRQTVFNVDPAVRILRACIDGAELIHIVDLDGAKDPHRRQYARIRSLVRSSPLPIQTGGGIRSYSDVRNLLELGVERVVIGSFAVYRPELVRGWVRHFGPERITLALDVRVKDGRALVATHGWLETTDITLDRVLRPYLAAGVRHLLVTDISRDGMLQGANYGLYEGLARKYQGLDIIASGGISSLDDIRRTARSGATSVVLGRALLEGRFTVKEAIRCWQNA